MKHRAGAALWAAGTRPERRIAAWLQLALLALAACSGCRKSAAPPPDAGQDAALLGRIRGAVVYQRPDGIYKTAIGEKSPARLAKGGTYPRWSPDGRHVAFVRGDKIMRVSADGRDEQELATARHPQAVAYHPNGTEVLFTDGETIRSVNIADRTVRTVVEGQIFRELDIAAGGRRLVATIKSRGYSIYAYDLVEKENWRVARGCSASLSPDGQLVSNNGRGHTEMYLWTWKGDRKAHTIHAPPGRKFDNQFWSNRQDWLASKSEGREEDIYVHHIPTDRSARATFTGDCDRPDLFIGEEAGR